ncbi:pentapeptide repeat-containing protein [Marinospirillum sp.]|uniref:pentapeptide repeat-containing protein n=1 Tax=Marinospirillum sp. TaxID=2183934 RepID=UPI003A86204F
MPTRRLRHPVFASLLLLLPSISFANEPLRIGSCVLQPSTQCAGLATELKYKDLKNLDLRASNFSHTSFHGSSLDGSDLRGAHLVSAEFDMSSLEGVDLREADLSDALMSLSRIHHADLRGAILFNVDLRYAQGVDSARLEGAQFCNTRLPSGELSHRDCPE